MFEAFTGDIEAQLLVLLDVFIAIVLGGIVGYEREKKKKPAGFRTNMIISGSTALLYSLGRIIVYSFYGTVGDEALGIDPTRIIHAIIVGVSFIGAGTILKAKTEEKVYFLTTSATILLSAGIGISVATKQYVLAVGITVFVLMINVMIHKLESSDKRHGQNT
jgi:putative Mg2+ transporter-C (MgtC) family protein